MPIRAEMRAKYPANWKQLRARILDRAQRRCESCGVGQYSVRLDGKPDWYSGGEGFATYAEARFEADAGNEAWPDRKYTVVVLTIAHLDHDPANNDERNLKALCQRCHLTYDAKEHAKNAAATRAKRKAGGR